MTHTEAEAFLALIQAVEHWQAGFDDNELMTCGYDIEHKPTDTANFAYTGGVTALTTAREIIKTHQSRGMRRVIIYNLIIAAGLAGIAFIITMQILEGVLWK